MQSFFAKHNFGSFPIAEFPKELLEYNGKSIPDYHDFVKVKIGDSWLTVDAVFDSELEKLGFPKLEWDGLTNIDLPVEASEVFPAEGDMEEHKQRLISALSEQEQRERKQFLADLTSWLDAKRAES